MKILVTGILSLFLVGAFHLSQAQNRPKHLAELDNIGHLAFNNPPAFHVYYQDQARFVIGAWCQTLLSLLERQSYSITDLLNKGKPFSYGEVAELGGKIVREMESICGKVDVPKR